MKVLSYISAKFDYNFNVLNKEIYSIFLSRLVKYDIYFKNLSYPNDSVHLLLINDGQDGKKMGFLEIFNQLNKKNKLQPLIAVGIHTNERRIQEYGVAYSPDYLGRGNLAGLYSNFIMNEFIPSLRKDLKIKEFKDKSFIGWSLGALSAMDIVWNHPHEFKTLGLFSPSFWWRRKSYENGYTDYNDRLMHLQIRGRRHYDWLRFFFECGAKDEYSDRNNNGIIDSIDDCLDLIKELKKIGYKDEQISYLELSEGKHDLETWKSVLPLYLEWAFGKLK